MLRWTPPLVLFLVGAALAACERGGGAACEARVAVMREVFARIPDDALKIPLLEEERGRDLVPSDRGRPYDAADVTIHVLATGEFQIEHSTYDLASVRHAIDGDLETRDRRIADDQERARNPPPPSPPSANPDELVLDKGTENRFVGYLDLDAPKPPPVPGAHIHISVAPTAPLADLFALLPTLRADAVLELLVRDPREMPSEADLPAEVQPALQRMHAWEADIRANPRLTDDPPLIETMSTCSAFRPLVSQLWELSYADRERLWMREAPAVVLDCGCKGADVEGLTAITWRRIRPDLPLLRVLPLPWTADPSAERLELPATARGADLVRAVEARGATPVHLTLAS